ncbi:MAG: hypothetical protein EOO52_13620 [Gammaproteobacteria bacterium]|nr:MAG: hypothetical protein EOO52_13620 [Gammaproteobacteria bacterium]
MSLNKFAFSNSFMSLYVGSMGKIFEVAGFIDSTLSTYQTTSLRLLHDKNLISVSRLPLCTEIDILATQYNWLCRNDQFENKFKNTCDYTNFYMRVDNRYFPIAYIDPDIEKCNSLVGSRSDDVGHIAIDQLGNHYWASNQAIRFLKY